jgi:hypothetical protein
LRCRDPGLEVGHLGCNPADVFRRPPSGVGRDYCIGGGVDFGGRRLSRKREKVPDFLGDCLSLLIGTRGTERHQERFLR